MEHLGLGLSLAVIFARLVGAALQGVFLGVIKTVNDRLAGLLLGLFVLFGEQVIQVIKAYVLFVFVAQSNGGPPRAAPLRHF